MTNEVLKKALKRLPSAITFEVADDTCTMYIEKAYANMQDDGNAFEGWALLIKSYFPNAKIVLDWKPISPIDSKGKNVAAYNRFLYRVGKFEKIFGEWFQVSEDKQNIVADFGERIRTNHINNLSASDSGYNPGHGAEHIIEKDFSWEKMNQKFFLEKLNAQAAPIKLKCVFDQLPNGLFEGSVKETNRIFPTGYFDLWGIDDKDNLCIFELKELQGNRKVGIVSELFFYAWFAYEYCGANINSEKKENLPRGYDKLVERSKILQNGENPIKAYFLVKQFRAGLDDKIDDVLKLLNSALKNQGVAITFGVVRYDESWLSDKAKEDIAQRKPKK